MRCIMFVMPVASDTHRHLHVCLFSGGGPGMENAHDSGEKASADLWEIKSDLGLVGPASDAHLPLFERVAWMVYFSSGSCLLSTVCGKAWGMEDAKIETGRRGCVLLQGDRQRDFDPQIETVAVKYFKVILLPPFSVNTLSAFSVVVENAGGAQRYCWQAHSLH